MYNGVSMIDVLICICIYTCPGVITSFANHILDDQDTQKSNESLNYLKVSDYGNIVRII